MRSLRYLLPVGSRINTPIRRTARQGGMGRDHFLIKPEHGIISRQTPSTALLGSVDMHLAWIYPWHRLPCQRGFSEEKEGPTSLKDLLCL